MNSYLLKCLLVGSTFWVGCAAEAPKRSNAKVSDKQPSILDAGKGPLPIPDGLTPAPVAGATLSLVESRASIRVHPYRVLVNKLKAVTALSDTSETLVLATKISQSLGSYNHAAGVLPESKWSSDIMGAWSQVIDLACNAAAVQSNLQQADGAKNFIEKAYGRPISAAETKMISELKAEKISAASQARVLCTVVLSSTEFVTL